MIVGIIPARGGSKGIPRKNIKLLSGISLLERGIRLLRNAGCDQVYVSTEDLEIANLGSKLGAQIISRPLELASDTAGTDPVLIHAATSLNLSLNDILVLHQLTSPLLTANSVKRCIDMLKVDQMLNSVITIRGGHPFVWREKLDSSWDPEGHSREIRPRRQDLGVQGIETGGCYAMRVNALMEQKCRFPAPTSGVYVNYLEALDIDTSEDFEVAGLIFDGGYKN